VRTATKSLTAAAIISLASTLLPTQDATAVVLHGVQQGNPNLVTVDSVTGLVTNVGLLPAGSSTTDPVQGLTGASGNRLLYTDGNTLGGVHQLNPANAALIQSFALVGVGDRGGLSFDSGANSLFSVNNGAPIAQQSGLGGAVNLNFVAIFPIFPGAIGGDDKGRHFAQAIATGTPGLIYEFNPVTGALLNSFPLPAGQVPSGLAYDGTFLYASDLQSNTLFTLDPNTGAIVNGVSYTGGPLTALAFVSSVPEPTTLLLLGLGLTGLGFARKRLH